jgi:uncharacterized membrane protein YfcA
MTGSEIAMALALMAIGALVQGSIGFGLALVAAPLLVRIDPSLVPGPLMFAGLPLVSLIAWRERQSYDLRALRWPLVGQLGGTVIALLVLRAVSRDAISLLIGSVILLAVLLSLVGLSIRPSARNLFGAGTLAGFMGTTASIPGPPLALVHQHVAPSRMRGTMAPFLMIGNALSLTGLWWAGRFGASDMQSGLILMPGAVAGFLVSGWTAGRVDQGLLRRAVLLLSSLSAGALIWSAR